MAPGEYRLNARFFGYLLLVNFKFHVCAVKTANEGILILAKMARLQLPAPSLFFYPASKPKVITTKNSQQQQQAVMIIAAMCLPQRSHANGRKRRTQAAGKGQSEPRS